MHCRTCRCLAFLSCLLVRRVGNINDGVRFRLWFHSRSDFAAAGYLAQVPADRASACAQSAEAYLAASAKQLLAEAAAEALRAQARRLVSEALTRSAAAEALSAQACHPAQVLPSAVVPYPALVHVHQSHCADK